MHAGRSEPQGSLEIYPLTGNDLSREAIFCKSVDRVRDTTWQPAYTTVIATPRDQIWTSSTISGARAQYIRNSVMHELCPAFRHHVHAALKVNAYFQVIFVVACILYGTTQC